MSFTTLGLSDALARAVAEQGYTTPTPIQREAIPAVLAGGDLLAAAQTGTGKTAGFVLPLLQRLFPQNAGPAAPGSRGPRKPRALVLAPTRELAAQVEASVRAYGRHLRFASATIVGGVGFGGQAAALRRGVDIVVATPGRLLDHATQRNVDLSSIEILVLDEADRMLDMGFLPDIRRVLAMLPKKRQNLLFSATFSDEIRELASKLLDHPRTIEVAVRNSTVESIVQKVIPVGRDRKRELLSWMIGSQRWEQVLVFTRTKHGADKLAQALGRDGIRADAIHGNKTQGARTRALADFKRGDVTVLVATDIAARGIDIAELPRVVNFDLPNVPEDYVHRIGRTGRAGAGGEAVSLVSVDEQGFLRDIEKLIRRTLPREVVAGFEPDPRERAQPVFASRGGRGGSAPSQRGRAHASPGARPHAPGGRTHHAPTGRAGHTPTDGRAPHSAGGRPGHTPGGWASDRRPGGGKPSGPASQRRRPGNGARGAL